MSVAGLGNSTNVSGLQGSSDGAVIAVASLLNLRRPLEAFLRTGMLGNISASSAVGEKFSGRDDERHEQADSVVKRHKKFGVNAVEEFSCFPQLKELLPRAIIPLFESSAGIKHNHTALYGKTMGAFGEGKGPGTSDGLRRRQETKMRVLRCLQAVLGCCKVGGNGLLETAAISALGR